MEKHNQIDTSKAPYYDRNLNDEYTQVLFKPGQHVQAGELNEQQSMAKRQIKGVADCFLKDGDIRSGAQVILEDVPGSIEKDVTVTDGKIYLNGAVRPFQRQKVRINGKGQETIGLILESTAVSFKDNESLLSPASGKPNYGQPGADRLQERLVLTANNEKAATIYLCQDGKLVNEVAKDQGDMLDKFLGLLARRTYDESGHYKVWGMELHQKAQQDKDNLYVSLSKGKAYVKGWEIEKQVATTVAIPRATAVRSVNSEPKIFESGTKRYPLNNNPASKINRLTAVIKVNTELTRQGSVNGTDPIPAKYAPVVEILSIKQKSGTSYKKNTDFVLENDTIRWLNGGSQPDLGATYQVEFTYNKTMVEKTDYRLVVDQGKYYVELLNGDTPVDRSQMLIDYDFYLYYISSITLDADGNLRVVPGQADTIDKVAPPDITDQDTLLLGYVQVAPVNDTLKITNSRNMRSDMARIQRMFERLEDMEINQAITDLDKEAIEGEDATQLKGIFTDGFLGFTKSDINHLEYNASIDLINNELTLGYKSTPHKLTINKEKSNNYAAYERIATAKGQEKKEDSQPYATRAHRINPFTVFPKEPSIKISPAVDNWIDTNSVTIEQKGETQVSYNSVRYDEGRNGSLGRWYEWRSDTKTDNKKSSKDITTTNIDVSETAIEYMRPIEITVTGERFFPRQDKIKILFNDVKVDATPLNDTYKGTDNTLMADENGVVKAKFTVPKNTRCGTVNVQIYGEEFPNLLGNTPFTANGTLKTTTTTHTTTTHTTYTTVYTTYWRQHYVDPVAQTFTMSKDQMLSSIGLYFASKDEKHDLRVQIRGTDNGYPSQDILTEQIIPNKDIQISNDSGAMTKIVFDNPVYIKAKEQYAITVLTNSPTASIYVQELGKKDLLSKKIVLENPYIPGLMFESSNAVAWSAKQDFNLKFDLFTNDYEQKATVVFNSIKGVEYDSLMLLADTSVPVDCKLEWQYSTDDGTTWLPMAAGNKISQTKKITNATVKAILTTKGNVSPALALDSLLLVGGLNDNTSVYVSRNITLDGKYTSPKIVVDVNAPTGTGVVFYYATDRDGKTWKKLSQQGDGKVKEVGGYIEYTYTAVEEGAKDFRVKCALTTNNPCIRPRVKNLKCILK